MIGHPLVGPNGCEKTSLLRAILGRVAHTGTITLGHGLSVFIAEQHGERASLGPMAFGPRCP